MRITKTCAFTVGFILSVPTAFAQTNFIPVGTGGNRCVLSIYNAFPWNADSIHIESSFCSIRERSWVTLVIYDVLGRRVRTLVNGERGTGRYSVVWNGMNNHGQSATSGVYFARLTTMSLRLISLRPRGGGVRYFSTKLLIQK